MKIEFLNEQGDFLLENADETSYLYFPIGNEGGVMSSITPDLNGDNKISQNAFLMEPVSIEDLHTSNMGRNMWARINGSVIWSAAGTSVTQQSHQFKEEKDEVTVTAGKLWHLVRRRNKEIGIESQVLSYCPASSEKAEIMKVTFKNTGNEKMDLVPTAAVPIYGRSADNLRDQWRDLWQDSLALLLNDAKDVRNRLISYYGGVRIDGSNATIIDQTPGKFIADRNSIVRVWMDHGMWPLLTTSLYIHQTGDGDILFQKNIELVKRIQDLEEKPQIIVVSGYDDFNYAVEALRHGVREYLLKPIERDKINGILVKINEELEDKKAKNSVIRQIGNQQLKYLILNQKINDEEIKNIEEQFSTHTFTDGYVVCQCNAGLELSIQNNNVIVLNDVDDYCVIIGKEKELSSLLTNELKNYSVGISKVHEGIRELREAYLDAVSARKEAFVKCVPFCYYKEDRNEYETIPDDFADQFVQLFGTGKMEGSLSKLSGIQFKAKNNKISLERLLEVTDQILAKLIETYERMIEFNMKEFNKLKDPLRYQNADEYYDLFFGWIRQMQQVILEEFNDYKNKEKINTAIGYIHENYSKDLNMAVVSNYISMNYSLFSLNFKEYTGMNFVNYLKRIRIEEAKKLLAETEEKVLDISREVGYDNEKHFMKTFKSVCGVSPTEYRRNAHMGKNAPLM